MISNIDNIEWRSNANPVIVFVVCVGLTKSFETFGLLPAAPILHMHHDANVVSDKGPPLPHEHHTCGTGACPLA